MFEIKFLHCSNINLWNNKIEAKHPQHEGEDMQCKFNSLINQRRRRTQQSKSNKCLVQIDSPSSIICVFIFGASASDLKLCGRPEAEIQLTSERQDKTPPIKLGPEQLLRERRRRKKTVQVRSSKMTEQRWFRERRSVIDPWWSASKCLCWEGGGEGNANLNSLCESLDDIKLVPIKKTRVASVTGQ